VTDEQKAYPLLKAYFFIFQEILKAKETPMPCSVLEFYRRFRVKYSTHFQYTRMSLKAQIFKYMSRFLCILYYPLFIRATGFLIGLFITVLIIELSLIFK
jgi:hypothetical protein